MSARATQRILIGDTLANVPNLLKSGYAVFRESYAGAQCGQIEVVAPVQRKIHDSLIVNHLADGARFGIEQRSLPLDVYGLITGPTSSLTLTRAFWSTCSSKGGTTAVRKLVCFTVTE